MTEPTTDIDNRRAVAALFRKMAEGLNLAAYGDAVDQAAGLDAAAKAAAGVAANLEAEAAAAVAIAEQDARAEREAIAAQDAERATAEDV